MMPRKLSVQGFNSAALISLKSFHEVGDPPQQRIRIIRPGLCSRRPVLKPQQSRSSFASDQHSCMRETTVVVGLLF